MKRLPSGVKISVTVRTWVADGAGHATPVSTEELVSFTRG